MKWTELEIEKLKELYEKETSVKEIESILGRSRRAIINKAYILGITKNVTFSEKEIEYIVENYGKINLRELAENIGRTGLHTNICRKAKQLGLTDKNRKKIRHKDTPEPINRHEYLKGTRRKYHSAAERNRAASARMIEWHKKNEHPRGMAGKTHSEEFKKRKSQSSIEMWKDPNNFLNSEQHRENIAKRMSKLMLERLKHDPNIYTNAKGGTREDLGFYVRSRWEANVARYLNLLKEHGIVSRWEYESETFHFKDNTKGVRTYTPDFKVWKDEKEIPVFWEVKGFMDEKSKTRLGRMKKEYPNIEIKLIQEKEYKEIGIHSNFIENWEFDKYSTISYSRMKSEYLR